MILHCQVLCVCVCACVCIKRIYSICVCRKKASKVDNHTLRESVSVCVFQRWEQEDGENMRTRLYVREKQAASPLFSGAGYQAARQQGGIITEAVTFLWFLWFQHEAGGRLWLTHSRTMPAWKLLARGQYMTFPGHFNLRRINYRTVNLCTFQPLLLEH